MSSMQADTSAEECTCLLETLNSSMTIHEPQKCYVCKRSSKPHVRERNARSKRDHRAEMSESQRLSRLSKRQRSERHRSDRVIASIDNHLENYPTVEERTYQRCCEAVSTKRMEEAVCCVCDCFHLKSKVRVERLDTQSTLVRAFRNRLKSPPNLPASLQEFYDTSDIDSTFSGILLSRAGIDVSESNVRLHVCFSCHKSLLDKKRTNPPKFAIANGLYIGRLPTRLESSTFTENAMLNLSEPMDFISVVRGGVHASLRSHAYFFRADPAPPAKLLPRDLASEAVVGVTMIGALTPTQKAATMRKCDVRVPRLREQLDWYRKNNHLYEQIYEIPNWETPMTTMCTRIVVDYCESDQAAVDVNSSLRHASQGLHIQNSQSTPQKQTIRRQNLQPPDLQRADESSTEENLLDCDSTIGDVVQNTISATSGFEVCGASAGVSARSRSTDALRSFVQQCHDELDLATWRHNAPTAAYIDVSEEDESCEQEAIGVISDFNPIDVPTGIQMVLKAKPQIVVHWSSSILSDFHPAFLVNAFCELFPYGRGGLDEPKAIPISLHEFIKYCLRLSSRRHSQHRSFSMVAFCNGVTRKWLHVKPLDYDNGFVRYTNGYI